MKTLYVAASCPPDGATAWSWRLVTPGAGFHDGAGGEAHASPYRLHLLALLDALERIPDGAKVELRTTDKLLVDVVNELLSTWQDNDFRKKQEADLLRQLPDYLERVELTARRLTTRTGDFHAKDCKAHAKQASKRVKVAPRKPGPVTVRPDVEVVAWTDGGARKNPGPAGWGTVLVHRPSGTTMTLRGGFDHATNQRMELMAIAEALDAFERPTTVEVRTDSKFSISVCTEWIAGWKRRGWTRANGDEPINLDVIQRLDPLLHKHRVVFTWVPGHSGEPGNELADQLCNDAIDDVLAGRDPSKRTRDPEPPFPIVGEIPDDGRP